MLSMSAVKTEELRQLPSVDELLRTPAARQIEKSVGAKRLAALARDAIAEVRDEIRANGASDSAHSREELTSVVVSILENLWRNEQRTRLRKVINATGVIVHTNLGRAPLSEAAKAALLEAAGYCTIEYDADAGMRGKRGAGVEQMIAELVGAEAAIVVNNCAAAAFFVLSAFAKDRDVIVSRGELVEIGGDFRVPDVLEQSGATLREVGTTNRTKLKDYQRAIGGNTGMILRVHPSNYRIVGFTESPNLGDLADLAHQNDLILYEDAGSGAVIDLSEYGMADEPVIGESIKAGVDVVSFSGDKLLGAAQAGIIAGREDLIERLRKHPLYRALRVDKLIYSALQATLESYARETHFGDIPVLKMLSASEEQLTERSKRFAASLAERCGENLEIEIIDGESVIGGGSAPTVRRTTKLIAITKPRTSADELETHLRRCDPPVIARIIEGNVVIDLRTVAERDETLLVDAVTSIFKAEN